jgi:Uma2 family endonuclease
MVITDWDLTLEQFLDLPEATPALEYDPPCDGQGATVRQKMSPTAGHSAIQTAFVILLDRLEAQGLLVRTELRVVRRSAKVPDVCVYAQAALEGAALLRGRYPTTAPQLAIEIRSPDDDLEEQVAKCRFYVDEWGCPVALLVDPESAVPEILVYRPQLPPLRYQQEQRVEPLYEQCGLELTPNLLWSKARLRIRQE